MTFSGTAFFSLSILITIVQRTSPEFVVHEVVACCHHEVNLGCSDRTLKIGIVQARYLVPGSEYKYMESRLENSWSENGESDAAFQDTYSHPRYVSLWDMDVTFVHEILHSENRLINLNEPEWMRYFQKIDFVPPYTTPNPVPAGFNFSQDKLLEMPLYKKQFLDKNTIWTQPLFPLKYQNNHSSSHMVRRREPSHVYRDEKLFPPCLSYEALLSRGQISTNVPKITRNKSRSFWRSILRRRQEESERKQKPTWHYTDLRSVFNQRCSGRTKCAVDLLRNKLRDQDLTRVCNKWPDGRIVVKYLCYDSSSRNVHGNCNEDMETAREGFIVNPGYPNIYPGGLTCQWRLQVTQQRILLVFLDVSLRGQDKSTCRDELVISEQRTKILSTCGDHKSAIAVLSSSSSLNVTFIPRSRVAFPKRGFLLYFRALGCNDPKDLSNSYIVSRNASHIYVHCVLGCLFPDSLTDARWLSCNSLENTWVSGVTFCQDIRSIMATNGTINLRPVFDKDTKASIVVDYIVPVCIMLLLLVLNGFVLLWIRKMKERRPGAEEDNEVKQEMEEILKSKVITPEESTYTLSSDGTEGAIIGPTIKTTWMQDDNLTITTQHEPITAAKNSYPNGKATNGGIAYTPIPTNTNGNPPFPYGFPRSTAV